MTALAANRRLDIRNMDAMTRQNGVILTGVKIYKHAFLARTAAGKIKTCTNDGGTGTFFGIAEEECATGDGTRRVNALNDMEVRLKGVAQIPTSFTAGIVEDTTIFCADDNVVTQATTLGPAVGILKEYVGANDSWLLLRGAKEVAHT